MTASCTTFLAEAWELLVRFLNSNFTAALFGALAGALAGAQAAQRISESVKRKDSMLTELRSVNSALMVAFGICNSALSLKKQYIKEAVDTYKARRVELIEFQRQRAAGERAPNETFHFQADLRTFQMPRMPIDLLRSTLFEKISASGRPLAAVMSLDGAIESLAESLKRRAALIEHISALEGERREAILPAYYFGLPFGGGHVTTEFQDTIEALGRLTDDIIFFGELLIKDLREHGHRLLLRYKDLVPKTAHRISDVDFGKAREAGLMPHEEEYADWLVGFVVREAVVEKMVPGAALRAGAPEPKR